MIGFIRTEIHIVARNGRKELTQAALNIVLQAGQHTRATRDIKQSNVKEYLVKLLSMRQEYL